jgi:SAM-dependent methyltransferase
MRSKDTKLDQELHNWQAMHDDMVARKQEWALEAEAAYISGFIYRATLVKPNEQNRVLSIGSGPIDVIDYWPSRHRYSIDPLADEYKKNFPGFQDKRVNYVTGYGENLPYEDNFFDMVYIRNALDHVEDPRRTLQEVHRVLRPGGAVYIWVHLYHWRGSLVRRWGYALAGVFSTEPWAFTGRRMIKLLKQCGFKVLIAVSEDRPSQKSDKISPRQIIRLLKRLVARRILNIAPARGLGCTAVAIK